MATSFTGMSRSGQSGDFVADGFADSQYELFLKVFSGEVLAAMKRKTFMEPLHTVRTISHGESATYPLIGRTTAKYHQPGTSILTASSPDDVLQTIKHAERVIKIDSTLMASTFVSEYDEMLNHYSARQAYATQLGEAIAVEFDKKCLAAVLQGAAATSGDLGSADDPGGAELSASDADTADGLIALAYTAAQTLDEKHVGTEGRTMVVKPEMYYKLAQAVSTNAPLMSRDYSSNPGDYAMGQVFYVAGFRIVSSAVATDIFANNGAATQTGAERNSYYAGEDWSLVKAVCFTPEAIGTVRMMDTTFEAERLIEYQGTLMVARLLHGTAPLRTQACVKISDTA